MIKVPRGRGREMVWEHAPVVLCRASQASAELDSASLGAERGLGKDVWRSCRTHGMFEKVNQQQICHQTADRGLHAMLVDIYPPSSPFRTCMHGEQR
jgi:hypothetical protein